MSQITYINPQFIEEWCSVNNITIDGRRVDEYDWISLVDTSKNTLAQAYGSYMTDMLKTLVGQGLGFLKTADIHRSQLNLGGSTNSIWWLPCIPINESFTVSGNESDVYVRARAGRGIINDGNIFTDNDANIKNYLYHLQLFMINSSHYYTLAELMELRYFANILGVEAVIEGNAG